MGIIVYFYLFKRKYALKIFFWLASNSEPEIWGSSKVILLWVQLSISVLPKDLDHFYTFSSILTMKPHTCLLNLMKIKNFLALNKIFTRKKTFKYFHYSVTTLKPHYLCKYICIKRQITLFFLYKINFYPKQKQKKNTEKTWKKK